MAGGYLGIRGAVTGAAKSVAKAAYGQSVFGRKGRTYPTDAHDRMGPHPVGTGTPQKPSVRAMQQFLRAHGYNISVDGVLGPQTKAAAANWRGARNPRAWNAGNVRVDDPNRTNSPTSHNNQRNQPGQSPNNNIKPQDAGHTKGIQGSIKTVGVGRGLLSNNAIDPNVYARAMVDSKYGPILGELARQEAEARTAGESHLAQAGGWYDALTGNIAARGAETNAEMARVQNTIGSVAPGIMSALGLGADSAAAPDIAAEGSMQADYQRSIGASQSAFSRDLASVADLQRVSALQGIQGDTSNTLREIQGQRSDAIAARGNEYTGAAQDARVLAQQMQGDQLKNRLALFQAQLAAQTAPLEYQGAVAKLQSQLLGNQGQALQNTYLAKRTAALKNANKNLTGWQDPKLDRDALLSNALSTIKTQSGTWRLPMNPAWARVQGYVKSRGLDPNSARGREWMRAFATIAGIRLGPKGNPIGRVSPPKRK